MPTSIEQEVTLKGSGTQARVADLQSRLAVMVAHPWGPLGGNLHNPVVVAAVLYFQRLGITTIRFDFCGSQIGRGYRQVEQVEQIAASLLAGDFSKDPMHTSGGTSQRPTHLLLVGYSYGALITASATANIPACIGSVSMAPPFGVQHWLLMFHSNYHLQQAVKRENLPRLCVIGNQDNFTSEKLFLEIVQTKFPDATTGALVKGADHFFAHREKDLCDVVGEWLLTVFPQCQGDLRRLRDVEFGLDTAGESAVGATDAVQERR